MFSLKHGSESIKRKKERLIPTRCSLTADRNETRGEIKIKLLFRLTASAKAAEKTVFDGV